MMSSVVTMIIIGMTGAGGISISTTTTSMEHCIDIKEKMKDYNRGKILFATLDRQISVECISKESK